MKGGGHRGIRVGCDGEGKGLRIKKREGKGKQRRETWRSESLVGLSTALALGLFLPDESMLSMS